ncbi:DUF6723 family protein [Paraburkholderia tropica]|uniref:DUF6723 family protein n=1 Tax=Paraburkholderia tropica TaxID=92647 RepID=UPI003D27B46F
MKIARRKKRGPLSGPNHAASAALLSAIVDSQTLAAVYDAQDFLVYANQAFIDAFELDDARAPVSFAAVVLHNADRGRGAIEHRDSLSFIQDAQSHRRGKPGQRTFITHFHDGRFFLMAETLHESGWITLLGVDNTAQSVHESRLEAERRRVGTDGQTDVLAGLPNRQRLLRLLETAARACSSGVAFTVAMAEIDGSRAINEASGHAAAQETLTDFARISRRMIRAHDVVGWLGGQQFLFIFPELTELAAQETLRAINHQLQSLPAAARGIPRPYSFSCSVYTLHPGDEPANTLKQANETLCRAKRNGRARVEVAGVPSSGQNPAAASSEGNDARGDRGEVPARVLTAADYEVKCGQGVAGLAGYRSKLRIRRLTDGKLIYPFEGCLVPGPFQTPEEARAAALRLAEELMHLDMLNPEL